MRLSSVEGNRQRLDGGAMFGNVPRALWARWSPPDDGESASSSRAAACSSQDLDGTHGAVRDGHRRVLRAEAARALRRARGRARAAALARGARRRARGRRRRRAEPPAFRPRRRAARGVSRGRARRSCCSRTRASSSAGGAWERARAPHPRDRASFIPGLTELLERSGRLEIVDGERGARCSATACASSSPTGIRRDSMHAEIGGDGGVVFCSDLIPGAAVGASARDDGLRPLPGAPDRRETAVPRRTRSRAACGCSSRTTSNARSRAPRWTRPASSAWSRSARRSKRSSWVSGARRPRRSRFPRSR